MVQVSDTMLLNATHIHRDVVQRDSDMRITLDFEARFLRRKRLMTDCGNEFMVDLVETVSLDAGDAFVLELVGPAAHVCDGESGSFSFRGDTKRIAT